MMIKKTFAFSFDPNARFLFERVRKIDIKNIKESEESVLNIQK